MWGFRTPKHRLKSGFCFKLFLSLEHRFRFNGVKMIQAILDDFEHMLNDYVPPKRHLLFIPESRQGPFTSSKLYLKVQEFFQEASLNPVYHIVFVSHVLGASPEKLSEKVPGYRVLGKMAFGRQCNGKDFEACFRLS